MLRRRWLEFVMGAAGAAVVTRDWLVGLAEAAEVSQPQEATPKTVAGAIQSRNATTVASFVLTYPTVANAATVQEKGTMVYLLGAYPLVGSVWDRQILVAEQERQERAALTILRSIQGSTSDMEAVLKIAGGREVLERKLPQMRMTELKTLAQPYVKP